MAKKIDARLVLELLGKGMSGREISRTRHIAPQRRTVSPERTFWEKATILHKETFRTNGRFPSRYSRHYYDLYRLAHSSVKERALSDTGLLKSVVDFKMTFCRSNAARYDLCAPGTLRLVPPEIAMPLVEQDYASMQNMIFGSAPDFSELMSGISELESEINDLASAED
ncbi:nucleotidyl transferase AbiEii/AbiGii toxin family protein [Adlercreutzia sp. ZJ141]|uniref:nucleotidyl transferase AbiEii/AbiGii toxin family protein n=1 Tax=Adlercreutzia sp. ZJ141 TaxID=2709406 RepID=UPI0013EC60A7|nr:nucleotidyl transferase AbiEii/AbiGii toxin family protein [Adlercreutzia sp. ZJ141]